MHCFLCGVGMLSHSHKFSIGFQNELSRALSDYGSLPAHRGRVSMFNLMLVEGVGAKVVFGRE